MKTYTKKSSDDAMLKNLKKMAKSVIFTNLKSFGKSTPTAKVLLALMKKITFFGITQGMMWSFFCSLNGYGLSDWQWWVIVLTGCTIWSIIYHKCKKDD